MEENIKKWRGTYDNTILIQASWCGSSNVLRWLLHDLKFDVNEQLSNGTTALHVAAIHNQMECARLLLNVGSKHLKMPLGDTPLDYAKRHGYKDMQRLIESHFQLS